MSKEIKKVAKIIVNRVKGQIEVFDSPRWNITQKKNDETLIIYCKECEHTLWLNLKQAKRKNK